MPGLAPAARIECHDDDDIVDHVSAESVDGEVSTGQIDFVQYRYTPVSVNVGYEYGEVETFEYGRSQVQATDRTTFNGVPTPMADTARP